GIVLLEAMFFNRPIMSTNTDGAQFILHNNNDSLVCNINDPNDMASKLLLMIKNESFRFQLSRNAYNLLENNYTLDIIAQNISKALILILKGAGNTAILNKNIHSDM